MNATTDLDDRRTAGGRQTAGGAVPQAPAAGAGGLARPAPLGDVLTCGFGTCVAMWAVGYFTHLPGLRVPAPMVLGLLLAVLLVEGVAAGRISPRGVWAGLWAGLVTGLLNLLVLGSLLEDARHSMGPAALWWMPASVVLCMGVMAIGAAIGRRWFAARREPYWPTAFGIVAVSATLLLLMVGGVVTGYKAGLAVPDWPQTYGYNMFLYPLSRMTGGIYYEHAHRLIGALVGLTTLAFAAYVSLSIPRRAVRVLALIAAVLVIAQGVMGGVRVTGQLSLEPDPNALSPQRILAVVHGITAQAFLTVLVIVTTLSSPRWLAPTPPQEHRSARTDRRWGLAALHVVLAQIVLGAIVRHYPQQTHALMTHLGFAFVVLGITAIYAMRIRGVYRDEPLLRKLGTLLLGAVSLQVLLGFAALGVVMMRKGHDPTAGGVLITTAHQTLGAIVFALSAACVLWHRRLNRAPAVA